MSPSRRITHARGTRRLGLGCPGLGRDHTTLLLARDIGQVRDLLRKAGADDPLTHVHRTVDDAVAAIPGPDGG